MVINMFTIHRNLFNLKRNPNYLLFYYASLRLLNANSFRSATFISRCTAELPRALTSNGKNRKSDYFLIYCVHKAIRFSPASSFRFAVSYRGDYVPLCRSRLVSFMSKNYPGNIEIRIMNFL